MSVEQAVLYFFCGCALAGGVLTLPADAIYTIVER